jgi:hypothetical protein
MKMQFNRMIVTNVERLNEDDAERFVYKLTDNDGAEVGINHFGVAEILLLDNGWVKVKRHDTGEECFPPYRVVALEIDPMGPRAVPERTSDG